jgi:hypothetical protein
MDPGLKQTLIRLAEADSRDLSEYCRVALKTHAAMVGALTVAEQQETSVRIVPQKTAEGTQ